MFPLNLPNVLTLVRIMLVPVLVVALLDETPNGDTIAAIVFAIAALTDGLDGYIARSRESITTFGKVMDPIADKLLIAAALISLVSLDRVAAWVAMVIIAREFAVSGLRVAAGQQGVVIPASLLGKAKTILQVAMVMALIAVDDTGTAWVQALVYLAVAMTVISGADYFLNVRKRIEEARQRRLDQRPGRARPRRRSARAARRGSCRARTARGRRRGRTGRSRRTGRRSCRPPAHRGGAPCRATGSVTSSAPGTLSGLCRCFGSAAAVSIGVSPTPSACIAAPTTP